MTELKERMKLIRTKLKLTQKQIADILGVGSGKIKQIESGKTKNINYSDAKLLENALRINEKWLRTGEGEIFLSVNGDDFLFLENEFLKDDKQIPFYGSYQDIFSQNLTIKSTNKTIYYPHSFFFKKDFLLASCVPDNSMQKSLNQNDIVIIDTNSKSIKDGKVFLIYFVDEFLLKRVFKISKDKFLLKVDNPYYPNIELNKDDFIVLGEAIQSINFNTLS